MEINQETLNALLALNDEELQQKFRAIAAAIGINERIAAANTGRFRSMLASSTPEDLNRMVNSLGAQKADNVMRAIDNQNGERKPRK